MYLLQESVYWHKIQHNPSVRPRSSILMRHVLVGGGLEVGQ